MPPELSYRNARQHQAPPRRLMGVKESKFSVGRPGKRPEKSANETNYHLYPMYSEWLPASHLHQ